MRFGTASYFIGIVKLTGNFETYYIKKKKSWVTFCEARIGPARPRSRKQKPLTRVIIYLTGIVGNQVKTYYKEGDFVLVHGRLKIFKTHRKVINRSLNSFSPKEYHLGVIKMSLILRPTTKA